MVGFRRRGVEYLWVSGPGEGCTARKQAGREEIKRSKSIDNV
jgi:hypothetical protein